VLAAAFDELRAVGFAALSIDDVAQRAGVHKTTVYRRWPTKADLIGDAALAHADDHVPLPDTGDLATDLQLLARAVAANLEGTAATTRALVAASLTTTAASAGMREFWTNRLAASTAIIERAAERGDVPRDTDAVLAIEMLVGPLWLRFLLTGEPIDGDVADRLASTVAAALSTAQT
jgi:AcrR family transcriptional regulator